MKTVSIGRTRYTVLDSRDVFATHALATGKHKRQKSKGAEKRQYPVFNPDMSTAEYVRQYFALNKLYGSDATLQFEPLRDEPCHAAQGEDTLVDVCPECGSDEFSTQFTIYTGIETNYQSCHECGHQWGFE